ncbi:unnamed protein product [Mytilus edulis]|uniref:Uncharacterized protein n=1 Tax=Mytilus edulis TaxID=6550 RepID=A0A8S3RPQ0_MYTED|nr:unnamed protein product [Mytilus edulis]
MDVMGNLYDKYKHKNDIQNVMKTTKEMEKIEEEFIDAENDCRDYLTESKVGSSVGSCVSRISKRDNVNSGNKVESKHITKEKEVKPEFEQTTKEENNNKQLKSELGRNKRNYQSWKAAFLACINQAPATKEYKLLQLRQYVEGEALQVIENLGHSAVAFDTAKERLERKYGGQRRQITLYIEELENFKTMREGIAKDIEHFADLLDIAVVNLKEAESQNESYTGNRVCKCCNGNHGVWKCNEFRKLTVNKGWDTAKRLQLRYRCLGHDHVGRQCPRSRACNLRGCKEVHNRLLHRDKQSFSEPKVPVRTESKTKQNRTMLLKRRKI